MEPEETRVYIAILIAGIIFCLVVITFLVTIVRYQKKSVAAYLDRMKADLSLLERERARMASDVHDELGSQLAAALLLVEDFAKEKKREERGTERLTGMLSGMMLSVRQLSNSMVPYALSREGLLVSLEGLIQTLFSGTSLRVITEWKLEEDERTTSTSRRKDLVVES